MMRSACCERGERFRQGSATAGDNVQALDGNSRLRDARLPVDNVAVQLFRLQTDIGKGGRENLAPNGQDFARDPNCLRKVACQVREGSQKQVAEAVAAQAVAGRKTVIEKLREELFVLSQCDHAVANVARREDAEVAS